MGFWFIPFIGVSILVLGVLSMVVLEYQDQKSRRFDSFKSLRCPELEKGLKCEFGTCVRFTLKKVGLYLCRVGSLACTCVESVHWMDFSC